MSGVSTPTPRLRVEQQPAGSNPATWGDPHLNQATQRLEEAICGFCSFTLSGAATLSTANFTGDQAHFAVLNVTGGTGGTVTIPSVEKLYTVINGSTGQVVITTGSGLNATLNAGEVYGVACDGANCRLIQAAAFANGSSIKAANISDINQRILRRFWLMEGR